MAETELPKMELNYYTIQGTNGVVEAGDCVLIRPAEGDEAPHVARVVKIEADRRNVVNVCVRLYCRPEELFLSDHYDYQSAETIERKCMVHSLENYTKLVNVGADDYFCRFEYKAATGEFIPDTVAVYCMCEMPYNPDVLMVQCERCEYWYHHSCMGMTIEEAKLVDHFLCTECVYTVDIERTEGGVFWDRLGGVEEEEDEELIAEAEQ